MTHQGLFPSVTISFNLKPGAALGDAVNAIAAVAAKVGLPPTIQTQFAGTAQAYEASLATEPILITAALVAVLRPPRLPPHPKPAGTVSPPSLRAASVSVWGP